MDWPPLRYNLAAGQPAGLASILRERDTASR